jgi:hypothetical protein
VLSIHARVEGAGPAVWEDPSLVQVWGPRFSAYVVAAEDRGVFTLGRLPDDTKTLRRAEDTANRIHEFLAGRAMKVGDVGRGVGIHHSALRYAAPTGTVLIRWDGARAPTIWTVSRPDVDPVDARLELARRYLHVFGPGSADSFSDWAGIKPRRARAAFEALGPGLTPVRTPIGQRWILAEDEPAYRQAAAPPAAARLLPSGDTYYLLQGDDRELLIPELDHRRRLWTPRVWPGAVLVEGDIVGTWRRAGGTVTVQTWRRLPRAGREAVEAEAASLPLPDIKGQIVVRWEDAD